MPTVSLVYLPYGPLERPSLAFSILSPALQRAGIDHKLLYANFAFAELIGTAAYHNLAWVREEMVGEWTFAGAAFPDFHPDHDAYLDAVVAVHQAEVPDGDPETIRCNLWQVRKLAEQYIEELAVRILNEKPRIVACTSSFNQNCAMLAFTRAIKRLDPSVVTIVGGANCEAEMGHTMACHFPWLDYVVSGEGEEIFPALCRDILENRRPDPPPYGVFGEHNRRARAGNRSRGFDRASLQDLNQSPVPDFSAYFDELSRFRHKHLISPGLLIETARGCWWGEKQHCTFCGLNGGAMAFRSKTAERSIEEYHELAEKYGMSRFLVVDNILSLSSFNDLLPALASSPVPFELLFEIKANVQYKQLELLHDAGGTWIQPGIEALHDDLLALMKKGTKGWINVQLLKWARTLGQHVSWNLLCGFPGERDEWFAEVAEWLPLIEHLQPAKDVRRIRFDRFSPYQARPSEYGLELRSAWPYRFIYPLAEDDLQGLVYIFEAVDNPKQRTSVFVLDGHDHLPSLGGPGRDALQALVYEWNKTFLGPLPALLCMTEQSDRTFIYDTRHVAPQRTTLLTGITHRVHRALDSAARLPSIVNTVNADGGESVDAAAVQAAIEELIDRKLVLRFADRYLALAVRGEVPVLPKRNEDGYPGGWIERRSELPTLESQVAWAKPSPATVHQVAQQHSLSPKGLASKN